MKTLYISYDGATDPLGQSQIIPYIEKLAKNGLKFHLLTFDKPYLLKNTQKVTDLNSRLTSHGIQWRHLNYHKSPSFLATAYDLFKGIIVGARIVRLNKIEIVHARGYPPALISLILKKVFKLKFIFDVRGLWADEKADAGAWPRGGLFYKLTKYLEKIFFLNADAVVVLTKKAKNIIEALPYYKDNSIKVIPTCVDLNRFKPLGKTNKLHGQLKNKFVIIYLGSTGTWYMLEEMIEFFKIAKRSIKNAFFLILTPKDVSCIQDMLEKGGLIPENFCVKSVHYEDVPNWLSIADLSVAFIKPCFSKLTSCPTKLGESLASGIPLVINRGIGDTEEITKGEKVGIVIDNFTENSYKKAVDELLELLEDSAGLRERCRTTAVKYFSLRDGINSYLQIYKKFQTS